jgi:hypothetical protein
MQIAGVVLGEPAIEGLEEGGRAGPLVQLHQLLLQGPQEALGVGVAFGIAVAVKVWRMPRAAQARMKASDSGLLSGVPWHATAAEEPVRQVRGRVRGPPRAQT